MTIGELERALQIAQARVGELTGSLATGGTSLGEILAAGAALLAAECALAAAKGEPHAVSLDFSAPWEAGAPMPHLVQSDLQCFLVFYLREPAGSIGVVEFTQCQCTKFGSPNDEVVHGHPLHGRGLGAYAAQKVVNSPWIEELKRINAVHARHDPAGWKSLNHYIFGFHDSTFECIARSFNVEVRDASMAEVLREICGKLGS